MRPFLIYTTSSSEGEFKVYCKDKYIKLLCPGAIITTYIELEGLKKILERADKNLPLNMSAKKYSCKLLQLFQCNVLGIIYIETLTNYKVNVMGPN